jgi:hypothetical protein
MAAALREYGAWRLQGKRIVAFNVGCFPWHGLIELSVLTADELDSDPMLLEPGEIAAWHHYNFGVGLASWGPSAELGRRMSGAYSAAVDRDKPAVAEAYLRACAAAVARPEMAEALGLVGYDQGFRISVAHSDTGREFYPPGSMPGA